MRPSHIMVGEVRQGSASTCRRTPWTYGGSPSVAAPGVLPGQIKASDARREGIDGDATAA